MLPCGAAAQEAIVQGQVVQETFLLLRNTDGAISDACVAAAAAATLDPNQVIVAANCWELGEGWGRGSDPAAHRKQSTIAEQDPQRDTHAKLRRQPMHHLDGVF
eukprot:3065351-Prymnesium_polylepis.1